MKATLLLAALCAGPLGVIAQTTLQIAECDDLPSSITTDTTLQFIEQEISCSISTHVTVSSGVAVEITSAEASTTFNNIKFAVGEDASFLCTVPQLDWTSVETDPSSSIYQAAGGAAMRVEKRANTTFAEDVTFSAFSIDYGGRSGAAIVSLGNLVFEKSAIFKDTIDGGALFTYGSLTFEGDVTFENNNNGNYPGGNGYGAGLYVDNGLVQFKGAASFIGNEVAESFQSGGRGAGMYSHAQLDEPMVFSGPVLFKGNRGLEGALALHGSQKVIFESHVTFEDNIMEPTLDVDGSEGGGMTVSSYNEVEFQAGVTATGNSARKGGAFYFDDTANITMSGPANITGNTAQVGGAIYTQAEKLTLPADADISSNTATIACPGIYYKTSEHMDPVLVEFTDGATFDPPSEELCYLGSQTTSTPVDLMEDFDCESYVETAPRTDGYPYLAIDTMEVKTWNVGTSITGGFSCPEQLIIYVTGGEELTVISTAASATMENVRIEVVGHTKLVLEVPDFTLTAIIQSQRGGSVFVEAGSSMDVMGTITFMGNTVAYQNVGIWREVGGPAVYSEGDVKFHGEANFLGNGQYRERASGESPNNEPGGAVSNLGTMEFMKKATFKDNFNSNGGDGGAIANSGELIFNVRSLFQNNSVAVAYTDDGDPYNGRGGALYNYGSDGTVVFKGLAIFKDNVGEMGGCALSTQGTTKYGGEAEGINMITFENKAKFKDNVCDGYFPSIYDDDNYSSTRDENKGGGALLAYANSTVVFSNTAVFKRNEAPKGGAITNSATISFVSDAKLVMEDNISDTCADIENNDEGTVQIGSDTFRGPNADVCDRS